MKLLMLILVIMAIVFVVIKNENSSNVLSSNYGQYDKGTALCDKGAYGQVNNLCK